MNLRIIKPGVLDTVQDLGRYGFQHLGINPGGAMDKLSAQVANILVGNDMNEAVIEMHFPAAAYFFEKPALIALAGADFTASVNGEMVPSLQPILLGKFSILQFHKIESGARAYLAIHGGLKLERWLNSYSTHLKAESGGFHGRALQKDDEIGFGCSQTEVCTKLGNKEYLVLPWKADLQWNDHPTEEILAIPGNEWKRLSSQSQRDFLEQCFTITNQSDRMGYRLKGNPLSTEIHEEIVSSAVSFGTVQLLPDGQLIVLMADHQTTGGYPRIAHIISAYHSPLAQLKPGDKFNILLTDQKSAEELFLKKQQHLLQLQHACKLKLEEFLSK